MRKRKVLDLAFFKKINQEVVNRYRAHTFGTTSNGMKAMDIDGREYPDYKDLGVSKSKGTGTRQRASYKLSKAPVFSGDLLNDFQLRKTNSSGFSFGTVAWGSKVKSLANMGRVISRENKALPIKVGNYIMKEADKYVNKKLGKIKGRTFNIQFIKLKYNFNSQKR